MTKPIHDILDRKRSEVSEAKNQIPLDELKKRVNNLPGGKRPRNFKKALQANGLRIIAEIKRKSPSHGDIKPDLDVAQIAGHYQDADDVCCISVLTDKVDFGCGLEDMQTVRSVTTKPILRKDFILDEYQIYEARLYGADAVLLIACVLEAEEITKFAEVTKNLNMEPFVECHKIEDIDKVPDNADVVGINNRDLFDDDLTNTRDPSMDVVKELLPHIPKGKIVVAESGCTSADHMRQIHNLGGIAAVLAGAGILEKDDTRQAIRELMKDRILRPTPIPSDFKTREIHQTGKSRM